MPRKAKAPHRAYYHHGSLRQTLIDAAVQLAKENGPESVSVREAAKRAGVSPGAPFRHFDSKTALMTAVAEQAMSKFRTEIANALAKVASRNPIDRLLAIGMAYLHWAFQNPTQFQIVSTRSLLNWDASESLARDNDAVRSMLEETLFEAQKQDLLKSANVAETQIAARALVYGLARMHIDGHFPQWAGAGQTGEQTTQCVLKLFIGLVEKADPKVL